MKIFKTSKALARVASGPILTLGNFDGLHLGHRKIIDKVSERARKLGSPSVVYTFEPHPLKVVAPSMSPQMIVDAKAKAALVDSLGIDFMVIAEFTKEFAAKHPRAFVEDEIVPLRPREVWVGHDFSFGKAKSGTVDYLRALGEEFGFSVHVIPAYMKKGEVVSSSRIRRLVSEGKLRDAASLLGRNFSMSGKVVKGRNVGKELGFPTANLSTVAELMPADGVYAAWANVSGKRHGAVVNIGVAPTFGCKTRCVEVHILGFNGNIYGKKIEVEFVRRLRSEKAFKSKEALITQIRKDSERAARVLAAGK
ncbi:MAG: bifunctional riboflavin kinase/FAD synthetase [Deltaproteobacteria bacterium]|nr:bifunctional riboflavin kinase/FAD synthetase [Deltaproteobacteria bacterium]